MVIILKDKFAKYSDDTMSLSALGRKGARKTVPPTWLGAAALNHPLLPLRHLFSFPAVTNITLKTRYQGIPEAKAHNGAFKPVREVNFRLNCLDSISSIADLSI